VELRLRKSTLVFAAVLLAIAVEPIAFPQQMPKQAGGLSVGTDRSARVSSLGSVRVRASTSPKDIRASGVVSSAASVRNGTRADSRLKLPLEFEANRGQAPREYGYVAHGPTYTLGLSSTEIAVSLQGASDSVEAKMVSSLLNPGSKGAKHHSQLHLTLLGADKASTVTGEKQKRGVSNYFLGTDPSKWQTNVPHFGAVKVAAAYPGIDLVVYGNPQQLEYDFQIAPGADPDHIRLGVQGADATALDKAGDLILTTSEGEVQLKHPEAYQDVDGVRKSISSEFQLAANNEVEFVLGSYDHSRTLVVDPVLLYSVAIGGSNGSEAIGTDVDTAGNAYVTGNTCSSDFPSTAGSFSSIHSNPGASNCQDVFVMKVDPTASTLLYSDYIGGSIAQTGMHIAVDSAGDAFVTGATASIDFPLLDNIGPSAPVSCGVSKKDYNCPDGFILKLNPDGSQLLFSSLLGGNQSTTGFQVKLSPVSGDLLVLGETNAADFRPTPTTLQSTYDGGTCANANPCFNGFLLGLNPTTGALRYGTFLGSTNYAIGGGLAVDSIGDIYVTGSVSGEFSAALGAVTHTYAPSGATAAGSDAFLARFHLTGSTLATKYLTLIQGELDEGGASIAVDGSSNAYIIGSTASKHLPVTPNAFQSANNSTANPACAWALASDWGLAINALLPSACGTAFVGKVDSSGVLSFLSYLGGSDQSWGEGIAVDSLGNLWLAGVTSSKDFPLTADQYIAGNDFGLGILTATPFLAEMSNDGKSLPFATPVSSYYGQSADVKVDTKNNIYTTGFAFSAPSTPNVYPANLSVYYPAFVQKWGAGSQPNLELSSTSITFPDTVIGAISQPQTITATNTGAGPLELSMQLVASQYTSGPMPPGFLESDNCGSSLAAGASCNITVTFEPTAPPPSCTVTNGCNPQSATATLLIETNAAIGNQTISLSGTLGKGPLLSVVPNPIVFQPQAAGTTSNQLIADVNNTGDIHLMFSNISISGPNASEFQVSELPYDQCTSPVASNGGCYLGLSFSPAASATGTRTATLNLTDNAVGSPHPIPLMGTVKGSAPELFVTPVSVSYGPVAIGATGARYVEMQLTNTSASANVQITALTFGGANKGDFDIYMGNAPLILPYTITPGNSLYFDVQFNPTSGTHGLRQGTLTVSTNPAITGIPTVPLVGDAVTNSDASLTYISLPSPFDFGSLLIGQTSQPQGDLVSITNSSPYPCAGTATSCGGPLTITSMTTGLSDYAAQITQPYSYCTNPPLTIPDGGNCVFSVIFTPSAAGARNTTLTINSNDPAGATTIPMLGAGLALPIGNLSVTALDFGYSGIGVTSPPMTVTLQNIGEKALPISGVTASADFATASSPCGASLAPNASCIIGVTFAPPSAGQFHGTLTISASDAFGSQQLVALSGTGSAGALLRVTPSSLNFGNVAQGATSPSQTVTIVNTGDGTVTFPTGAFRSSTDFLLSSTTCGATLVQGASCTVAVQFKPSEINPESGSLFISDNARGNPQPVALGGVGTTIGGTPTVKLTSAPNPSVSGQAVTFTATVAGVTNNSPVPTGTVSIFNSVTLLGTPTLNGSGQASVMTSSLGAGSNTLSAIYSGDNNYASNSSPVLTQIVNASANAATTTTLTSSVNPAKSGQKITFTATVKATASNPAVPSGTITFMDGSTQIAQSSLSGTAQTSVTTSTLSAGSHSITAVYSGDVNFGGSTSNLITETVSQPALSVSLSPASLTFAVTTVGSTSAAQTVTVKNTGSGVLMLNSESIDGTNATSFLTSTTTCTSTLASGASCIISIEFKPAAAGTLTASLSIADNAVDSPQLVALSGTGAQTSPSSLHFIPVTPCRIADTRNTTGAFGGPELAAEGTRTFNIPQSACGIPSAAVAYSLNATVVPIQQLGYLTMWPAGQAQPVVSTLNSDGRVKANATITPAGANGGVSVYVSDATQFILDIDGYFVPTGTSTVGLEYFPVTPCRVSDTRNATSALGGPSLAANTARAFPVQSGPCGIPATAQAYSFNITAVPHGSLGFLTAWPSGLPQPVVSTLNSSTGGVTANAAIVPAGTGGEVSIFVSDASDVILDVNGYFAPPATGGLSLYTVTPCRALDTRNGAGAFDGTLAVPIRGSTCAPPATAQAYVLNATVIPTSTLSYLTMWAAGGAQPDVSTLNADDGAVTSNMAIVPTTNGILDAFATDSTQLILDLSSYFAP
jgi:hypothetical protein